MSATKSRSHLFLLIALLASVFLTGCEDEEDLSSSADSSSGGGCNFEDELSSSEREVANNCGTQATSQVQVADGLLDSAIRNCQAGEVSAAQEIYDTQYLVQVDRTESVLDQICGGTSTDGGSGSTGGVGISDPSEAEYYNLCVGQDTEYYYASCYGPVQYSDNSCPGGNYGTYNTNYNSKDSCLDARDRYLDNLSS